MSGQVPVLITGDFQGNSFVYAVSGEGAGAFHGRVGVGGLAVVVVASGSGCFPIISGCLSARTVISKITIKNKGADPCAIIFDNSVFNVFSA